MSRSAPSLRDRRYTGVQTRPPHEIFSSQQTPILNRANLTQGFGARREILFSMGKSTLSLSILMNGDLPEGGSGAGDEDSGSDSASGGISLTGSLSKATHEQI